MGLFRRIEKRATLSSPTEAWAKDVEWDVGRRTFSGKNVTDHAALSMSAVFFCVGLIADSVSSLPIETFRKVSGGATRNRVDNPSWLDQPNPYMTSQDFWHRVLVSLAMDGNAYLRTVRNDAGQVVAAVVLPPRSVTPRWISPNQMTEVVYNYLGTDLDASECLHIPLFTQAGVLKGMSPLEAARQAIGGGLTAEEFGARFFGQGTTMAGVIQAPNAMTQDEAQKLQDMFKKRHSGTKNSHAIGILSGGATWHSISITPEQAQFLETRRYSKTDVALFFRVPPYMVDPQVTSTWGTGIEEQNWAFVQNTLSPWLIRIEQAVSTFLLPGKQYIKFNLDSRLRPKTSERYTAYATGIENSFLNPDEVRALEDLPPIPGGKGKKFQQSVKYTELGVPRTVPPSKATNAPPQAGDAPTAEPTKDSGGSGGEPKPANGDT